MTTPIDGGHRYAMWDAAYVLGSLTATDRREYEQHLTGCSACRAAVAEISGVPALLSQLEHSTVAAIADGDPAVAVPRLSPELLPSLLSTVRRRRRRTRLATWAAGSAAAAVLGIGVLVGVGGSPSPSSTQEALPMAQVGTTALASTVAVSSEPWGSFIDLSCVCLAPVTAHHDTLALVVVDRDGTQTRLATWVAQPGHTATPAGSISTPTDQIASVQVVSADNGKVLLERAM
ncbi:anti-sigma factor family protein [[Mycobacterium] crassicus]|uniref:Zf-HC2 domain-containing protein n=1 Tax=[Mycobacterium] crassicus TaxID=2872309 RepID=A0ABU5XI91_9MYCO|nr:zf-HC2 domain-containing protein [Mycolicibacter sp. MYC098]MEB3021492.1 zf-HC2 domain-containing protein [Mycolicibacter sp. MYC098]